MTGKERDQDCFLASATQSTAPVCPACFHPPFQDRGHNLGCFSQFFPLCIMSRAYKGHLFICRMEPSSRLPSVEELTIEYYFFAFSMASWIVAIYLRNLQVRNVDYQVPHYLSTGFLKTHGHALGERP